MYEIQLTHDAQTFYQAAADPLVRKLNRCFDQLRRNPYKHSNIKRLKGSLAGYWRYRVG
ncbi:MAG: type II toxin-antitoxin system RelE/ParE family toxin, partial [Candidatus Latescibacterota bacterium]